MRSTSAWASRVGAWAAGGRACPAGSAALLPAAVLPAVGLPALGGLAVLPSALGIGLSLVKNIVTLHGGRVEGRSDGPGAGSGVCLELAAIDSMIASLLIPVFGYDRRVEERPPATREATVESQ